MEKILIDGAKNPVKMQGEIRAGIKIGFGLHFLVILAMRLAFEREPVLLPELALPSPDAGV